MELTATTQITMDGVTQSPGAPEEDPSGGFDLGGWAMPYFDEDGMKFVDGIFERADAFLFGRKTYEIFASYWPGRGDEIPISAALNSRPKHVVSSTLRDLSWEGASLLDGDLVEAVEELKRQPGDELQVHGSIELCRALLAAGLVDRHRLLVLPVALGSGARLFDGTVPPTKFRLEEARATGAGAQLLTYVPDGAVVQGHFSDLEEA
jgi:dihydrofolate reductase